MPVLESNYKRPPFYYLNGHWETILPSMFRKIKGVHYKRETIDTPDDDFLNIDWLKVNHSKLLVISHGLEGGSDRHYAMGLAKLFHQNGWDVAAWNNRSCNGPINKQKILYHHAATYDLRTVINHIMAHHQYDEIAMVGISMGGGQTLRYLGEHHEYPVPEVIKRAVVISAPVSLIESAKTLVRKENKVYEQRFLKKLKHKIRAKAEQFPEIDIEGLDEMDTLKAFDDKYSGPLHGFKDAKEFYAFCDPFPFVKKIDREVLILNALNDPLLVGKCFPYELAEASANIFLETPKRGGHVGFARLGKEFTYAEQRTLDFLDASFPH